MKGNKEGWKSRLSQECKGFQTQATKKEARIYKLDTKGMIKVRESEKKERQRKPLNSLRNRRDTNENGNEIC